MKEGAPTGNKSIINHRLEREFDQLAGRIDVTAPNADMEASELIRAYSMGKRRGIGMFDALAEIRQRQKEDIAGKSLSSYPRVRKNMFYIGKDGKDYDTVEAWEQANTNYRRERFIKHYPNLPRH